ncbi:MAG: PD-(D/E)XK nuclease family protein [Acidobacteriia bacterium]|nr:PD-(D/E)XK nuclease family protein [Terriglobia bacterium]
MSASRAVRSSVIPDGVLPYSGYLNLLISGPAASGKSRAALEHFQSHANRLLIVPTATMAEHARHALTRSEARTEFPVRPHEIRTLAHCLEEWSPQGPAPTPLLDLLIEQALERLRPDRFAAVAGFPGFRRSLAELFQEAPPAALPVDLASIAEEIEGNLAVRGLGLRHARLKSAAPAVLPANVILDGFFTLSAAETELILAIGARADVTITLPDWPGSQAVRKILLSAGFEEQRLASVVRSARRTGFSASTIEREVEEIARRILKYAVQGRSFREMGIVLRSRDPYAGVVETTLARFGIPARFYFQHPLGSHPALMYFSKVIRALLAGWDHETLLSAIRMPVAGLGATAQGDQLDFAWRDKLPGFGLPLPAGLEQLAALDQWSRERPEPQAWAARLKTLRTLLPAPKVTDSADRDDIQALRSTSAALAAFDEILDGAAAALAGSGRCALAVFWKQVETALALEPLRVPDARRNVVHVMDAYEARQWELPIVFVCGLIERHFPQYHREDPILGDAARQRAGLDTAADRQSEERFLFELATSRATEETILSYPRFDEQGEDTLPSFFIDGGVGLQPASGRPIVPRVQPYVKGRSEDRPYFLSAHKTLSPTGIESFLQCPFQFFASKTLRLRRRPPQPRDRLDLLLQGSILHRALAEWTRAPLLGAAILDEVFEEECSRVRVPEGYRTEAVRLELMRHFRGFLDDTQLALRGWSTRVEENFSYPLNPLVSITGRIDRLDVGPGNQALVIDYKYSAGNKIRERVEDTGGGHLVQGGLYLAAAQRTFGLDPVAMLFCGLKKDVTWDGWHVSIPGLEALGTSSTREFIRDLIDNAESAAVRVHEAITSGDIAVNPRDPLKCRWCDFCDICRVESAALVRVAT